MTASTTPREVIVEFDGLYFRIQKLRGRRAFRGTRALQRSLGQSGYLMLTQPKFWEADESTQLTALLAVESRTEASYDQSEAALAELLVCRDGQGVSYRESEPDPERPDAGWVPIRTVGSLDAYEQVDHTTWQSLRWEMIKLVYRPTSAAAGTRDAMQSAATTSRPAKSPSGEPKRPPTGPKKAETPLSGISGG